MKVSIQQVFVLLFTSLFALGANAHPGHDHSAWSSSAVHAVLYFSIAAAVVFVAVMAAKAINSKKSKNTDK